MSNILITIFAYLIDKLFGEFPFKLHPIALIGEWIEFFEENFYKDSVARGVLLVLCMLCIVGGLSIAVELYLRILPAFIYILLSSIIASIFIAHKMLYDSVNAVLVTEDKKEAISLLVSRDTQHMSENDIHKAAIETYAENLSDGVIAPMFYLLLFNLPGIIIYKAINTMDSMVGYKNEKYMNYGKAAAILDDIANYIPSRLTAVIIMLVSRQKNLFAFYEDGKKHDSPNAGHPITAMALALDVKLGGDTYYFGELKEKAHFGVGRETITSEDVKNALNFTQIRKQDKNENI